MRRVASRPSIPGMRMSISTTSGRVRRTASTASSPSAASATTSMPSAVRIIRKPVRTSAWSSATTTRTASRHRTSTGSWAAAGARGMPPRAGTHRGCAGPRRASRRRRASRSRRPIRPRPLPASADGGRVPPVSVTSICRRVGPVVDTDGRRRAGRVLDRVGQRLLHDPVGGQVDAGRHRGSRRPRHRQLDRQSRGRGPGRPGTRARPVPGCGARSSVSPSGGQQPHHVPQLGHRGPAAASTASSASRAWSGRRRPAPCGPRRPGSPSRSRCGSRRRAAPARSGPAPPRRRGGPPRRPPVAARPREPARRRRGPARVRRPHAATAIGARIRNGTAPWAPR